MNVGKTAGKTLRKTVKSVSRQMQDALPAKLRDTLSIRAFGFLKVPMIFFTRPSVVELTERRCEIVIPLSRRTKNHLNSMYFGALSTGADIAGGLIAVKVIEAEGADVSLVFKDFKADFLKRAEGDVHFSCEEGESIREFVKKVIASGERMNQTVHVTATVPSKMGKEPVAEFELTLSLKRRSA